LSLNTFLFSAYYGTLFTNKPETAFASYRLCESAGFIFSFGYSGFICTNAKIYVSLVFVVVGLAFYSVTEVRTRNEKRSTK